MTAEDFISLIEQGRRDKISPNALELIAKRFRELESKTDRYVELCQRHKSIMAKENIIISVYTNASGFLWNICKVDSGTDLGWCDFNGNCEMSGAFKTYEDCLEDAVTLIEKCSLKQFQKEVKSNSFHWGNYSDHLNKNYRIKK